VDNFSKFPSNHLSLVRPDGALDLYHGYRRARGAGPYAAYATRREAGCLLRVGREADAVGLFRKTLEMAPDHADTHLDLGLVLRDHGDLDGAVQEFRSARTILPDLASYAMALGTTYARQGRLGDAVEQVEAAVARRPTWAQAQANLGVLLLQAGRPNEAAAHLGAAAMLEPGNAEVTALLDESVGGLFIKVEALRLKIRAVVAADLGALVPVEPEPAESLQMSLDGTGGKSVEVSILDAEDEGAAGMPGKKPVEHGRAHIADLRLAGGTRGEADAYGGIHTTYFTIS